MDKRISDCYDAKDNRLATKLANWIVDQKVPYVTVACPAPKLTEVVSSIRAVMALDQTVRLFPATNTTVLTLCIALRRHVRPGLLAAATSSRSRSRRGAMSARRSRIFWTSTACLCPQLSSRSPLLHRASKEKKHPAVQEIVQRISELLADKSHPAYAYLFQEKGKGERVIPTFRRVQPSARVELGNFLLVLQDQINLACTLEAVLQQLKAHDRVLYVAAISCNATCTPAYRCCCCCSC